MRKAASPGIKEGIPEGEQRCQLALLWAEGSELHCGCLWKAQEGRGEPLYTQDKHLFGLLIAAQIVTSDQFLKNPNTKAEYLR